MSGVCILGGRPDYPGHKLGGPDPVVNGRGEASGPGAVGSGSSGGSSPRLAMSLDKVLDRAQSTGVVQLTSRNLKQFPQNAAKYKLKDTVVAGTDTTMKRSFLKFIFTTRKPSMSKDVLSINCYLFLVLHEVRCLCF